MIPAHIESDESRWSLPVSRRALPKRDAALAKVVAREQKAERSLKARNEAIVPATLLQKKLGATTFRLWCVLLTIRNESCETHPSFPGLERMSGIGQAQLEKSMSRLRDFKLVEDYGFMYRQVPCRCDPEIGWHQHKVYVRDVYGSLRASPDLQSHSAMVPRATAKLVEKAAGQGGARKGAGRPKGKADSEPRAIIKGRGRNSNIGDYKYQEPVFTEETTSLLQNAARLAPALDAEKERIRTALEGFMAYTPAPMSAAPSSVQPSEASVPTPSQPKAPRAPVPALTAAAPAAPADPADPPILRAVADDLEVSSIEDLLALPETTACITLCGTGTPRQQRYTPEDMKAATALSGHIDMLRVPAPPSIRPESSPEERLSLLKAAFMAAHSKVLGTDFWRPAKAMSDKERALLLEGAAALESEGLTPTAWASFSFHAWMRMGKKTAPSTRWVWSPARIHEHAGWCHESVGGMAAQAHVLLPSMRELMHRLGRLRSALGYGRPTDVVLHEVLPDTERKVLLAKAARERETELKNLERRIAGGEWVWG